MLKISRLDGDGKAPLWKLEGSLSGPWVEELQRLAATNSGQSEDIALDLSQVWFVDAAGTDLLHDLVARRVHLVSASVFVRELLRGGSK